MYHFNVPGVVIWVMHILIGLYFVYIGYRSIYNKPIGKNFGIILLVLGCIMVLYQGHIWLLNICDKKHKKTHKHNDDDDDDDNDDDDN